MTGLKIALAIVDIILAIAIIILFLVQEGNDQGMGVVAGGSSESYYGKAKGRTLDEQLKRWTVICAVLFAIVSVVLFILTEDMRLPMVIIDKWTPLMLLLMIGSILAEFILTRYKRPKKDKKEDGISLSE